MTGDTITTPPAHPQPWVCPTPDLNLGEFEWTACEVKPGTAYVDEPSVEIDPGWYVHGFLPEHDPRDFPPVSIKIEAAYDEHGCDRGAEVAQCVAATLTLAADAERERQQPRRGRLRRFAEGVFTFIGEAVGR